MFTECLLVFGLRGCDHKFCSRSRRCNFEILAVTINLKIQTQKIGLLVCSFLPLLVNFFNVELFNFSYSDFVLSMVL